jgi:hypothetical protein
MKSKIQRLKYTQSLRVNAQSDFYLNRVDLKKSSFHFIEPVACAQPTREKKFEGNNLKRIIFRVVRANNIVIKLECRSSNIIINATL